MLNLLTKSSFDISLWFKLKYAVILLLSYIVDCEQAMLQYSLYLHECTKMSVLKKTAAFIWSEKVEMISTFQRSRHFRKVSVNKTFTHLQEKKETMSPRHSAYIPSSVKPP